VAEVIEVLGLSKRFGDVEAVSNISFSCGTSEVVGFLGPNGAGKTTTMRMITGYLVPTSGHAKVAGVDILERSLEARRLIGYLPETVPLYAEMTVLDYLNFMALLRGVSRRIVGQRVEKTADLCGLSEHLRVHIGKLSKGFRQRVGLAQAIVHDPRVLVLDEPTSGIDPIQIAQTKQLIRQLGQDRTVLISSHVLPVVSELCERVIIINGGQIVAEDSIENLLAAATDSQSFELEIAGPTEMVQRSLEEVPLVDEVFYRAPHHIIRYSGGQVTQTQILASLTENDFKLLKSRIIPMELEDVFLRLTGSANDNEQR
jgi:ABC-2 type transport system ATP-binding protein